ncbi:MAG: hypothetical protein HYY80_04960 [Chloroflexi bacterium]|nr:hypothetical protein [Chloroflexota bacterium]
MHGRPAGAQSLSCCRQTDRIGGDRAILQPVSAGRRVDRRATSISLSRVSFVTGVAAKSLQLRLVRSASIASMTCSPFYFFVKMLDDITHRGRVVVIPHWIPVSRLIALFLITITRVASPAIAAK